MGVPALKTVTRWLGNAAPALFFVALALAQTWGVLSSHHPVLIGGGEEPDWTGTAWTWWWTFYALRHGQNPLDCDMVFHPVGQSPVAWYNVLDGLIGGPLMYALGPLRGYNATVLVALASAGLGGWALGRMIGLSSLAALVLGAAIQTSNYLASEIEPGRVSQAFVVFWLVALGLLDQLLRGRGDRRLAVAVGVAFALTHLEYWFYGLFLDFAAVILLVAWARRFDADIGRRLALAAGVAAALVAPFVISLISRFDQLPGVTRAEESWIDYGVIDRGEFSLANAIHESSSPIWPFATAVGQINDRSLSAAVALLALGGLLFRPAGRLRWLALLAFGWVMAMGPYLRWMDGTIYPLRLPYLAFYDWFPFFSRLWWPGRLALFLVVGAAALAALHTDMLASWLERRRVWLGTATRVAALGIVTWAGLTTGAYLPFRGDPPRIYERKAYEQLDGALLTTPVLGVDSRARHLLWFQIFHELPMLTGLGAHLQGHRPADYEAYIRNNSLLAALARVSEGEQAQGIVRAADVDALLDVGYRWAVVDARAYLQGWSPAYVKAFSAVFQALWGAADVRAGTVRAWRIERLAEDRELPQIELVVPTGAEATPGPGRQQGSRAPTR